jgi:hypothetical protein
VTGRFGALARFVAAMGVSLLPYRFWPRFPPDIPVESGAFASGVATLLAGAAIGIPGFLEHAHATTSLGLDAMLAKVFTDPKAGYSQGMAQGFAGLSVFTFLLLTPRGWLTMYLMCTGTYRAIAAWFDDPFGDPALTGIDVALSHTSARRGTRNATRARETLEGPEIADRIVTPAAAGIRGCDFVVVASRRKPGWERGVAVFTAEGCYRLGEPVERTVNGRLRTLYPMTEHNDVEAIRKAVRYDLPAKLT